MQMIARARDHLPLENADLRPVEIRKRQPLARRCGADSARIDDPDNFTGRREPGAIRALDSSTWGVRPPGFGGRPQRGVAVGSDGVAGFLAMVAIYHNRYRKYAPSRAQDDVSWTGRGTRLRERTCSARRWQRFCCSPGPQHFAHDAVSAYSPLVLAVRGAAVRACAGSCPSPALR